MIEEKSHVVAIEGEKVCLEVERTSSCGQCSVNMGCGSALITRMLGNKRTRFWVANNIGAKMNDKVIVGIKEDAFIKGSFVIYLLPLFALFLFSIAGISVSNFYGIGNPEAMSIFTGLAGLVAGFFMVGRFAHRIKNDSRYQPRILRIEKQAGIGQAGVARFGSIKVQI